MKLLIALALGAKASQSPIARFTPKTDVVPHSKIDKDQKEINDNVKTADFDQAMFVYQNGGGGLCSATDIQTTVETDSCYGKTTENAKGNSIKGSGAIRTLFGFATSGEKKMASEAYWNIYKNFWKDPNYADTFVDKDAYQTDVDDKMKSELIKKGVAYQANWMYVIHEFEDAIADCLAGDIFANDLTPTGNAPHAWDEGWAFYAGSLEGERGGLAGVQLWNLAAKRCKDFGTCEGTTDNENKLATANQIALDMAERGRDKIGRKMCNDAQQEFLVIVNQMTVPLIQGMLKYAYKSDPKNELGSCFGKPCPKELGEAWAFAAAVLPRINTCSSEVAEMIRANLDVHTVGEAPMKDGYVAFKTQVESTYDCLGLSCDDIGEYQDTAGPYPGMEACTDIDAPIAGFVPTTNVVPHSKIDKDQKEINTAAGAKDQAGWDQALFVYENGGGGLCSATDIQTTVETDSCYGKTTNDAKGNSIKGSGKIRTIEGFATSGKAKMSDEKMWQMYSEFWGDDNYCDTFVRKGLEVPDASMKTELFKKGTPYQCVWQYVLHEFEDAIADCLAGNIFANDKTPSGDAPHAWDEGWAFYAGSLEGKKGTKSGGVLLWNLSNKRASRMKTAVEGDSGTSTGNIRALGAARAGQELIIDADCDAARSSLDTIKREMLIPLVQGSIEYAYKADPASDYPCKADCLKEWGEGWAFAAAALPQIAKCDSAVADMIVANLGVANTKKEMAVPEMKAGAQVKDGFVKVKEAIESTYSCLGITCKDIGEWKSGDVAPKGMEMCTGGGTAGGGGTGGGGTGGGGTGGGTAGGTDTTPPPASSPRGKKKTKKEVDTTPIIIVCVIAAVLLLASICLFMKWRQTESKLYELAEHKQGTMA